MKQFKILAGLAVAFLSGSQLMAQQCLSDRLRDEFFKQNPEAMKADQAFYDNIKPFQNNSKRAGKLIIPVVFHVMHTNGAENISKEQIQDQIRILNEDYSKMNANTSSVRSIFTSLITDMQLEFQLAKIDPNGNCTDGINRVYSPLHVEAGDAVKAVPGARWDYTKYLNIWVVSSINSTGSAGTILGYAQFPSVSTFRPDRDGVVCRADYVGSIGTSNTDRAGRVLTHEIGHWLGLLHPFQDDCEGGDYCDDTPPVTGQFTNANCNPNVNSCHNDVPDMPDQFENFMDYAQGKCQAMFTPDQKAITRGVLEVNYSFRKSLWSNSNLIATGLINGTGTPQAFFSSNKRMVCIGEPVTFYDESCKSLPTSRQWTFMGASTSSTNLENPTITYTQSGKFKVMLTVTNSNGSNTKEIESYIEVKPAVAATKPTVVQGFENSNFEAAEGWYIRKDAPKTWQVTTAAAYGGTSSLYVPIDSSTTSGQRFQFETPPVDMRRLAGKSPKMSFMIGYARRNSTNFEVLRVYVSKDCGTSWTQMYTLQAGGFVSNPAFIKQYKPSQPSDWRRLSIGLTTYENDSNIMFRFEIESGSGNPVYVDNINISQFFTDINDLESTPGISLYPNPAGGKATLAVDLLSSRQLDITMYDVMGKQVQQIHKGNAESGAHQFEILQNGLPEGIYLININTGTQLITKKIIFAN